MTGLHEPRYSFCGTSFEDGFQEQLQHALNCTVLDTRDLEDMDFAVPFGDLDATVRPRLAGPKQEAFPYAVKEGASA